MAKKMILTRSSHSTGIAHKTPTPGPKETKRMPTVLEKSRSSKVQKRG